MSKISHFKPIPFPSSHQHRAAIRVIANAWHEYKRNQVITVVALLVSVTLSKTSTKLHQLRIRIYRCNSINVGRQSTRSQRRSKSEYRNQTKLSRPKKLAICMAVNHALKRNSKTHGSKRRVQHPLLTFSFPLIGDFPKT